MLETYPQYHHSLLDEEAAKQIEWLKSVIIAIRTIRSEMNIAPGKLLRVLLRKGSQTDRVNYDGHRHLLFTLAKIERCDWIPDHEAPPQSATAFVGELEIFIPMAGFINKEEEAARLNREIARLEKDLSLIQNKLQNPQFVDKAPAEVVTKERSRQNEIEIALKKLRGQLEQVMAF